MQDAEYGIRRILLLRTRVNKGKKKGRSVRAPPKGGAALASWSTAAA
jgi:hypothetical protein